MTSTAAAVFSRPRFITTAIVPARNEAACIAEVVSGLLAQTCARGLPLIDEVVVADNGSSDGTARVALQAGACVVDVPQAGYGRACFEAVLVSSSEVLLFVDGDGAVDPADAARLLDALAEGADLAVGIRTHPEPGAMSLAQRSGNALICALMRRLWHMTTTDLGPCRAIRRSAYDRLDMRDRGFGWTVEMQVRAHTVGLRVAHRPVAWRARRGGHSKVGGNVLGVLRAGCGMLGMIARLWWRERRQASPLSPEGVSP